MSDLNCQVPHQIQIFTELDFSITEFEIMRAVKSLERNKSPGLDNILNEFLVARKECLIRPLCKLLHLIFSIPQLSKTMDSEPPKTHT